MPAHLGALLIFLIVAGLALGLVPTNIFSAAVEAVGDERLGGLAMAIIMAGQNAGFLPGPIIFGLLVGLRAAGPSRLPALR